MVKVTFDIIRHGENMVEYFYTYAKAVAYCAEHSYRDEQILSIEYVGRLD